ncbi:MAG: hypothetical protein GXX96_32675 [Planctomycetaceae bacterium]|nr:hypothetical protein [Planctomycetaceae bacterium]
MVLLLRSQTSRIRFTRRRTGCPATGRRQPARRRTGVDRRCSHRVAGIVVLAAWILSVFAADSFGQMSGYHSVHHGVMPPGAIGSLQLERGGPLPGYFQPVQVKGPPGVVVAMAEGGTFMEGETAPIRVGLLIGQVYRFRVMNIPLNPGAELFPTIEVVDRIYPPAGLEYRFPIVVELSDDDILTALSGKFLTKVIYLEDPETAVPTGHPEGEQPSFDIAPGTNPLEVADEVGRPVAILRMGAILPSRSGEPDMQFLFGCPPWVRPAVDPAVLQLAPPVPTPVAPAPALPVEAASR